MKSAWRATSTVSEAVIRVTLKCQSLHSNRCKEPDKSIRLKPLSLNIRGKKKRNNISTNSIPYLPSTYLSNITFTFIARSTSQNAEIQVKYKVAVVGSSILV